MRMYGNKNLGNQRPEDPTRCVETVMEHRGWQCRNRRTRGEYCGVHDPEAKAKRDAKRPPTKFELQAERWRKESIRDKATIAFLKRVAGEQETPDVEYNTSIHEHARAVLAMWRGQI